MNLLKQIENARSAKQTLTNKRDNDLLLSNDQRLAIQDAINYYSDQIRLLEKEISKEKYKYNLILNYAKYHNLEQVYNIDVLEPNLMTIQNIATSDVMQFKINHKHYEVINSMLKIN